MKKSISLFLIIVLFLNISCYLNYKMKYPSSIGFCEIKYVEGSIEMPRERRGGLIFYQDKMRIQIKEKIRDIPYSQIRYFYIDEKQEEARMRIGREFYRRYHPQPILTSNFGEALLEFLLLIGIFGAGMLLLKMSEDYDFLSLEFMAGEKDEWVILKAKDKELKKIIPILKERIALN